MTDTVDRIIKVSENLFKIKGYDACSVIEICKEAKISRGVFYYHFQSKEEVVYEIFERTYKRVNDYFPEIISIENEEEQLLKLMEPTLYPLINLGPAFAKAFVVADISNGLKELSPTHSQNFSYYSSMFMKVAKNIIEKGQRKGIFKSAFSADELLLTFLNAVGNSYIDWGCHNGEFDLKERMHLYFKVIFFA